MKTLAGVWASAALLLALATAPTAAEDAQVMVFGARALLHESADGGASFSAAGLTDLAMDALGLPTATRRVKDAAEPPASAFSAVVADLFTRSGGYAFVLAEDPGVPGAVDAALGRLNPKQVYHKLFPMRSGNAGKAMTRLAGQFRDTGALYCAGSTARCKGVMQTSSAFESVNVDALTSQLSKLAFLDEKSNADVDFARELAGVAQLADALALRQALDQDSRVLYVVAFSDLSALAESKREEARAAVTEQVTKFLAALQKAHPLAGAQVVAVKRHAKSMNKGAATATKYRQLDSTDDADDESDGEEDEEDEEDEDEDEEEEDELNLAAEDGSNATSAGNSTASPLTAQDIAEYQIVLWTSVVLVAALLLAVVAMGNMDVGRDSLLYAKFTTSAGHRKAD